MVIYPVAGVAKLTAVIAEHHARGTMDRRIQTVMRGSYASHYRRMLPRLLSVLRLRSNNTGWRPILDALHLVGAWEGRRRRLVPAGLAPPGSIPAKWKGLVVDDRGQLNVISYELCVLNQLRERVRARRSGSKVPTATGIRTRIYPRISTSGARPITPGLAFNRMRVCSLPISVPAWRKSCAC